MLEDELVVWTGLQQNGKLIETADAARQLGAIHEVDRDRRFFAPDGVKKSVLNILGRGLSV